MKLITYIFIAMIFLTGISYAKDVTITSTGYGKTQDEALLDSFYHAVQNANGVHVSSVLQLRNGNLTKDEIMTKSKGFIKGYIILVPYDGESITTKITFGDEEQQVPLEKKVKNTFTIGSTYAEVKAAHGIPNEVLNYGTVIIWEYYKHGRITFNPNTGRVEGYKPKKEGFNLR